jgi:hypothetical protein
MELTREEELREKLKQRDKYSPEAIQAFEAELSELKAAKQRQEERQEIEQKQVEHTGGLKENLFNVFEKLFPRETWAELLGPNEYSEKQQLYNQMVDVNVEAANSALYEHVGEQLEAKDKRMQEMTVAAIQRDAELEQAKNEAKLAQDEADAADKRYTEMLSEFRTLEAQYNDALNNIATKDREIEGRDMVIKGKEGEIQELREQLNRAPAPRAGFTDITANVSDKLQELTAQAEANNQRIKSRLEIALSGQTHRGPVQIYGANDQLLAPPIHMIDGGSESQESFRDEDTQADNTDREGTAEVSEAEVSQFPETNATAELAEHEAVQSNDGKGATVEARLEDLERRVAQLEKGEVGAAA